MVPCLVFTFPSKTFEPSRLFGSFLLLLNSDRESSPLLDKTPIFGEIWWVHDPETFHVVLLFETLLTYLLERAFLRLLPV
jgi:hypothetical protein